jgi:DNA-binding transcriptional MerR regulator
MLQTIDYNNSPTFSIGTLVERYGASAESFRNWERQGLIPPARRTPGGHRRYGPEHLEAAERLFRIQPAMGEPMI